MKTIRGKRALVTGGAAGIGREIALALAREGAHVFILDIDEDGMREVAGLVEQHGVEAAWRRCDVSKAEEITAANEHIREQWGGIQILINNAGVAYYGPFAKMTGEQWDWLLRINLHAPIQFTREWLPDLIETEEAHIINMASICGLVAGARQTAYHVSKFGLVGFTESLRADLAGLKHIGITAVCPGLVRTTIFKNVVNGRASEGKQPKPPVLIATTPEKVAAKTIKAIRRNKRMAVITPVAHILYFLKRLSPAFVDGVQRIRRKKKRKPAEVSDPDQQATRKAA